MKFLFFHFNIRKANRNFWIRSILNYSSIYYIYDFKDSDGKWDQQIFFLLLLLHMMVAPFPVVVLLRTYINIRKIKYTQYFSAFALIFKAKKSNLSLLCFIFRNTYHRIKIKCERLLYCTAISFICTITTFWWYSIFLSSWYLYHLICVCVPS